MIGMVAGFVFDTKLGKLVVAGVLAVFTFGVWLWQHDNKVEVRAEAKVLERSAEAGNKANEKATKAHDAAARPGAAERLRKSACRDC